MRILHTSDWHLGKRLCGKSRLEEQKDALEELVQICDREQVDVVLVAGDIFDTAVPPAEAEDLFYEYAVKLAKERFLVAIAGNHDDPARLAAPGPMAKKSNIVLVGELDLKRFTDDRIRFWEGGLSVPVKTERLNLAALPFPSLSRMDKLTTLKGESYCEKIEYLIRKCCEGFRSGEVNIFMSHLFLSGSQSTDERELGTAQILPKHILPTNAVYTALGHIHKPQTVSKQHSAYYSGSLLDYSFDSTCPKKCILVDTDGKACDITMIPIKAGKRLVRAAVRSMAEAQSVLEANREALVELTYESNVPLKPSDSAMLKSFPCFTKLIIQSKSVKRSALNRAVHTPSELFQTFYESKTGEQPERELVDMFVRVLNGEDL